MVTPGSSRCNAGFITSQVSSTYQPDNQVHRIESIAAETAAPSEARLLLTLARTAADIEDAQRLRFKVFVEEMGAAVGDAERGLEGDEFDDWCDHLIVRDADTLRAVGTYRILPPHRARALGRLYSEGEFDLSRLAHLRDSAIEVGRSCVHRDYRSGGAILLLWAGLARYMKRNGYRHLIGCASVTLADGGHQAARLRDELHPYFTDPELRVFPRVAFPHDRITRAPAAAMPPLIKGYLRLGARVCGEPAWDPDFNSADFLIWLALDRLHPRYARHFDLLAAHAPVGAD
jgi:putative hemolysin